MATPTDWALKIVWRAAPSLPDGSGLVPNAEEGEPYLATATSSWPISREQAEVYERAGVPVEVQIGGS
jgi:hypothetical protein